MHTTSHTHFDISLPNDAMRYVFLLYILLSRHDNTNSLSFNNIDDSVQFPNSVRVTNSDGSIATFQKQTGQVAPAEAAIGIPECCKCQHGYPQVFSLNPIPDSGKRMNSGLLKLTCPLLVNAIDHLEDDGFIKKFTEQVQNDSELQKSVKSAHLRHASVRQDMISDSSPLVEKLGEEGARAFLNSGIAGATIEKSDVKCLHAWLGDYLFTGESNLLGKQIEETLQREMGVSLEGNKECHHFCSPGNFQAEPPKPRNKQRLKTRKERDRRKRVKERNKETKAGISD